MCQTQRRGKGNARKGEDVYRSDVVEKADMHNERFEKYYKIQNILPEDEWDRFLEAMRDPLPTTFRVAGSRQYVSYCRCILFASSFWTCLHRAARLLNDTIKNVHAPHLAGVVFEGEQVAPPVQIPWYVSQLTASLSIHDNLLGIPKVSHGSSMSPRKCSENRQNSKDSIHSWFSRLKLWVKSESTV